MNSKPLLLHHSMQHDTPGKTVILFSDISPVSCSAYSHNYVIWLWFGMYMCLHIIILTSGKSLKHIKDDVGRILNTWIFHNQRALSAFNSCWNSYAKIWSAGIHRPHVPNLSTPGHFASTVKVNLASAGRFYNLINLN